MNFWRTISLIVQGSLTFSSKMTVYQEGNDAVSELSFEPWKDTSGDMSHVDSAETDSGSNFASIMDALENSSAEDLKDFVNQFPDLDAMPNCQTHQPTTESAEAGSPSDAHDQFDMDFIDIDDFMRSLPDCITSADSEPTSGATEVSALPECEALPFNSYADEAGSGCSVLNGERVAFAGHDAGQDLDADGFDAFMADLLEVCSAVDMAAGTSNSGEAHVAGRPETVSTHDNVSASAHDSSRRVEAVSFGDEIGHPSKICVQAGENDTYWSDTSQTADVAQASAQQPQYYLVQATENGVEIVCPVNVTDPECYPQPVFQSFESPVCDLSPQIDASSDAQEQQQITTHSVRRKRKRYQTSEVSPMSPKKSRGKLTSGRTYIAEVLFVMYQLCGGVADVEVHMADVKNQLCPEDLELLTNAKWYMPNSLDKMGLIKHKRVYNHKTNTYDNKEEVSLYVLTQAAVDFCFENPTAHCIPTRKRVRSC